MTLAIAILLLSISSPISVSSGTTGAPLLPAFGRSGDLAQSTTQSTAAPASDNKPAPQQQTSQKNKSPDAAKPAVQTSKPRPVPARKTRRKNIVPSGCDPAPEPPTSASTNPTAGSATQGAAPPSTTTPESPKNCPPPKIVVRQGGITEQSIQLAGGPADQAAQKRNAANQMLAATEDNLKKISGRQFSASQEDSISQIRQFLDQSKSALAAGNLERAQTLAWKAEVLSEDLIKPEK